MIKLSGPISLIKQSFKVFFKKENLKPLLLVYLPLLPFSILSLVDSSKNTSLEWLIGGVNILQLFVYVLVVPAAIFLLKGIVSDNKILMKEAFGLSRKIYFRFSLLLLVVVLVVTSGYLLLIIPGILFTVWFSFSNFIFVEQQLGIKKSLSESKRLVKGNFWKVFGRMIVLGIFAGLVGLIPLLSTVFGALFVLPSYLLYRELASADNI